MLQWVHALHHIVKIITHLMVEWENWIEIEGVKATLKEAKAKVQEALKPGKFPGGSKDDNMGVAYEFPDAKVIYFFNIYTMVRSVLVTGKLPGPKIEHNLL